MEGHIPIAESHEQTIGLTEIQMNWGENTDWMWSRPSLRAEVDTIGSNKNIMCLASVKCHILNLFSVTSHLIHGGTLKKPHVKQQIQTWKYDLHDIKMIKQHKDKIKSIWVQYACRCIHSYAHIFNFTVCPTSSSS